MASSPENDQHNTNMTLVSDMFQQRELQDVMRQNLEDTVVHDREDISRPS